MPGTIDQLNFEVIINDDGFKAKIEKDIEAAKQLNVQLSDLLDIKAKMPKQMKVSVDTREAENSLERLNAYFRSLEQADLTKIGQKINLTPQVEQAMLRLRQLEEEIEVIQQLRQESGGDMSLALELKKAQEEADNLLATIAELRQAETALNGPSRFQEHIRSLTEQSMEYKQLIEYYKAEEAASAEVAKEKEKEEKARRKNAEAIEKERKAQAKGEFKEYIESLTATNPTLKQMATYYKELERETANNAKAAKGAELEQERLKRALKGTNDALGSQSGLFNQLKNVALGYFSIQGASRLLSTLVRVTGEFELQKTTLAAMIGDLNTAEAIVARIQGLAVESPFQFKELTTYAKQLSAFAVPANELVETTKMLADISAGLGVGMDRIVLAYGQVRSAAFLRGQEVRQFTEAGIPILDELAKKFTELRGTVVSTGEVFDLISKRMVPFEMVADIFRDMTSEGGKFFNMQSVQADTLKGKISNLKDAYEVMLNEIGKGQSENLKDAVDWVRRLMLNYEELGKVIAQSVVTFGILRTAIIATAVAMGTLDAANTTVARVLTRMGRFVAKNPYTLIAAGLTAAGVGVYRWATRLQESEKVLKSVSNASKEYYKSLATEKSKLQSLYAQLELAKEGTEDYEKAKRQIYTQFAPFIAKLKEEGVAVDNLAAIYGNLTKKIEESQKAKFKEIATQSIEEQFATSSDKLLRQTERKIKGLARDLGKTWNEYEEQAFIAYVTGVINEEDIKKDEKLKRVAEIMALPIWQGVKNIRDAFKGASDAYTKGIASIDALYGKGAELESTTITPFEFEEGEESEAEKAIKANIKSIQDLQDAYESLEKYMDKTTLKKTLRSLFPNVREGFFDNMDFDKELKSLATMLEKYDEEAAQRLRDSMGKQTAKDIAELFEAFMKYKEAVDDWEGESFDLFGEGVSFDISQIIRDLNNEINKINQKSRKANELLTKAAMGDEESLKLVRETYGEEVWKKYVTEGKAAIDELANAEKDAATKTAQEKINNLAEKYVKDKTADLDLSDWGDKNLAQVKSISDSILNLYTSIDEAGIEMSESQKAALQGLGLTLEDFAAAVKIILQGKYNDTLIEKFKKIQEKAKSVSSALGSASKAMDSLGEATGSDLLVNLGKALNTVKELSDVMLECDAVWESVIEGSSEITEGIKDVAKSSDWITMLVKIVLMGIEKAASAIAQTNEFLEYQNELWAEYEAITRETKIEERLSLFDTIFGKDALGELRANADIAADIIDRVLKLAKSAQNAAGEARFGWLETDPGWWQRTFAGGGNIEKFFLDQLIDENGLLSDEGFKKLKAFYDSSDLTDEAKKKAEELLSYYDQYKKSTEAIADAISEVFDSLAVDVADNMIDAFLAMGDATANLAQGFDNVRESIGKMIMQSALVNSMKPYIEEVTKIFDSYMTNGDTEKLASDLNRALTGLSAFLDDPRWTQLAQLLQDNGLMGAAEETSGLSGGIKSITEDTANLLASYLNAIRADVSYSRAIWERMDSSLQQIAVALAGFSAPSLMEYQAQIASNTYNTMLSTQSILSRLESVIDFEASSIRVV